MDKELNDSDLRTSQDGDEGQSLVGKLKKNVSEIISNTPLSKWFRKDNNSIPVSSIRRRQDDSEDEEEMQEFQPPAKRTKLPNTKENLSLDVSEVLSPISTNNVKKTVFRNFPEPVAGPSGYQTRKMLNSTSFISDRSNNKIANDNNVFKIPQELNSKEHSDSEESTSGYSSGRIGSKEVVSQESSKQTSPLENSPRKNRSLFQNSSSGRLFIDRSVSPSNRNSSLSSRMPSFNPSTFGSSSFIDRTLSTNKILSSPFYNGHTIYGGASAYGRNTKRAPGELQKVLRQSVKIKPVNQEFKGNLQLGKTARRILDTLEQYSSPINDAKKIPVSSKKHRSEGSLTKFIGANPYTIRSASNKELHVPAVSDTLLKQKIKLQDSTEAARQIATKTNNETYQIPMQNEKYTAKMKNKVTSVRQKVHVDENVIEVKLNPISLPIKELPKFDISLIPPQTSSSGVSTSSNTLILPTVTKDSKCKSAEQNEKVTGQNNSNEFKFSAPLVLAEYLQPLKALNNYKFSEPLVKKRRSIHAELDQENKSDKIQKVNGENINENLVEKFKIKEGQWECSICLIRNQPEKIKCVACENPKPKTNTAVQALISLKPAENTWECPTCMIRNKEDLQKCAACEEKKPVKTPAVLKALENNNSLSKLITDTPLKINESPITNSFGNNFAKPTDSWECPTCMIRNKNDLAKCVACETPKHGQKIAEPTTSFGADFKMKSNEWECTVCMVRNKANTEKCQCCETAKPGSNTTQISTSFGSDFQKKSDEWECQVCMVRNKNSSEKCQCCESLNPNSKSTNKSSPPKATTSFSFGIDKNTASTFSFGIPPSQNIAPKTNASLVFGEKREINKTNKEPSTFSFGIPETKKESNKVELKEIKTTEATPVTTFTFQSKPTTEASKPTFGFGTTTSSEASTSKTVPTFSFGSTSKATPTFSFGSAKKTGQEPKAPAFSMPTPSISFGTPAKKSEEPTCSFGSIANKTENKQTEKINPLLKPGEKLPDEAPVAPIGFSFGLAKTDTTKSDETPLKRTRSEDDSTQQAKMPSFSFKAPTTNGDISKVVSPFSKAATETKVAAAPGSFNFSFGAAVASPVSSAPTFGSTTSQADSSKQETSTFKFGSNSSEQPKQPNGFSFGSSTTTFGAKPTANPAETKPFAFGNPTNQSTRETSSTTFGSTPSKPSMFSFGGASETKPVTFSFNAAPITENKPSPVVANQFSFAPLKTQAPAPSFGTTAPTFSFGSNQKPTEPSFGASTATNLFTSKSEPVFGAAPVQNPPVNGGFNFGATTSANKAGFSFGTANNSDSVSAQSGGFNFGASTAAASSSSGGFNFGSTVPSFDASAKPSFNFTGGAAIASFSAPPAQDSTSAPQRKIKKAIRRTVR